MTHDHLCDWWQDQCASECNTNLAYGDPCEHMWCTCKLIAKVRTNKDSKYVNLDCLWGQSICVPDCPECRRLDALVAERFVGFQEGYRLAIDLAVEDIELLDGPNLDKDVVVQTIQSLRGKYDS